MLFRSIVGDYGGSIFAKQSGSSWGGPHNYVGNKISYNGNISEGNFPNIFNIYGFLESIAPENFGGSNTSEDGLSAREILFALRILTSTMDTTNNKLKDRANTMDNNFGPKTAFSPYGRILVKTPQQNYDFTPITSSFVSYGIIPPTTNVENGGSYCEFVLDLSAIPNPPKDFRIRGPAITITDFLNQVTEALGYDYGTEMLPVVYDNGTKKTIYNTIKIKAISRQQQTTPNEIRNTINDLYAAGYNISSSNIGQEKNESPARCLIIGGKQQRLLQAKSYRLAYTQTNLIYNAKDRKFVEIGRAHV